MSPTANEPWSSKCLSGHLYGTETFLIISRLYRNYPRARILQRTKTTVTSTASEVRIADLRRNIYLQVKDFVWAAKAFTTIASWSALSSVCIAKYEQTKTELFISRYYSLDVRPDANIDGERYINHDSLAALSRSCIYYGLLFLHVISPTKCALYISFFSDF